MASSRFWWLKTRSSTPIKSRRTLASTSAHEKLTSSLAEFLEIENQVEGEAEEDSVDIPSILEEINRLAAKSPLGSYQQVIGELSIDEIMKEAEKIYFESSTNFAQLSQQSNTSCNISDLSTDLTPTRISPLPVDPSKDECSVTEESTGSIAITQEYLEPDTLVAKTEGFSADCEEGGQLVGTLVHEASRLDSAVYELEKRDDVIKDLLDDKRCLKSELETLAQEFENLRAQRSQQSSHEEETLEALKDAQEQNTALQLQLQEANKSNLTLRSSYDQLLSTNHILERRLIDLDCMLGKYKSDLQIIQSIRDKLKENEINANKLLAHEQEQTKSMKQQIDKDSKCILDLNRQIKEMERIITRKYPDSVSALVVTAKTNDEMSSSRKILEERILSLEQEAIIRDTQNSKVFLDVQEKFGQMKLKYESHIDDLELHVNDLKSQLKRRPDFFDVYTQTICYIDEKIPAKDTSNNYSQTDPACSSDSQQTLCSNRPSKSRELKDDSHLIATIRGYQSELNVKDKLIGKLQKDLEDLRRTNRRLQKEREGCLKKVVSESKIPLLSQPSEEESDDALRLKIDLDRICAQLRKTEADFQALKSKRLQDLNTLQEAHEREMGAYLENITPLREQLEMHQVTVSTLQSQLIAAKEELAIVSVERDHLNNAVHHSFNQHANIVYDNDNDVPEVTKLRKKLNVIELKYEEREKRLRTIVHGLAQKSVLNQSCEQCAERHQQLIGYKVELDQIIATLRLLK